MSDISPTTVFKPSVCLHDAACGLSQQMVYWGHDVRHPEGNVLVRYGLARNPSMGLTGTSCYSMPWESGRIELHGAVASWTPNLPENGSIFCRDRARIDLWTSNQAPIPGRQHGSAGSPEARWSGFLPMLRWLIAYESWVHENLGPEWRAGCWRAIKRLPMGRTWLPPQLANDWWQLAATSNPPRPKQLLRA